MGNDVITIYSEGRIEGNFFQTLHEVSTSSICTREPTNIDAGTSVVCTTRGASVPGSLPV